MQLWGWLMSELAELYNRALVKGGGPVVELGWTCLCCKDTAIISPYLLQKYSLAQLDALAELPSAPAYLCQKAGCYANNIQAEANGQPIYTERFEPGALHRAISPELCQWVHDQELAALRETQKSAQVAPPVLRSKTSDRAQSQLTAVAESLREESW